LSNIFVQMKLAIVPPERTLEVVPKISEYANSQNRVNAADFFANHPFHVRMEEFSRRIFAPSPDGTFKQTKWFYERARGQHQDARAHLTTSAKRKFDAEFPKTQVFTKTDLAKFDMVWMRVPHIVSRGAQKNFGEYAAWVGKVWEKHSDAFNESYYHHAIAKALVFREVERLVSAQPWYEGGYRANVVAYAISKVSLAAQERDRSVDFERIWLAQAASPHLMEALGVAAKSAHDVIINPPGGYQNVTEWAKQPACWERLSDAEIEWPEAWLRELITKGQQKSREKSAEKDQKILNGIQAQTIVVKAGGKAWRELKEWGMSRGLLSPDDEGILGVCALVPDKLPSDRQCLRAVAVLQRLKTEGYAGGPEIRV
jgi:AIPR protein